MGKNQGLVREKERSFEKSGKKLQHTEGLREKHQELLAFREAWETLENQLPEIEKQKKELNAFLQARTYLLPVWEKIKDEKLALEEATVGVVDCERFKQAYKEQIETLESQESDLKKKQIKGQNEKPKSGTCRKSWRSNPSAWNLLRPKASWNRCNPSWKNYSESRNPWKRY